MAGQPKPKIYVVIKSTVVPGDAGAKAGAKPAGVSNKLKQASEKAATRGLPKEFSAAMTAKPKQNKRPYDAIILRPSIKLTTESKGSGLKVTANVKLEVGAYKVRTRQTFMIPTNMSSKAAADGGSKFPPLADQAIWAVVEHITGQAMRNPSLKAKLKSKGFDL